MHWGFNPVVCIVSREESHCHMGRQYEHRVDGERGTQKAVMIWSTRLAELDHSYVIQLRERAMESVAVVFAARF